MTLGNFVYEATKTLNTSSARLDAELLVAKILNCSREKLYIMWDKVLTFREVRQIKNLFKQRKKGWPIAYLLAEKEFYGQIFKVNPPVFIPRPDTEYLVSAVLSQKNTDEELTIIDLGSGSGCVGLSLLKHLHKCWLIAVDKDSKAIQLSQLNACRLGLESLSFFLNKDVMHLYKKDLAVFTENRTNLVVANPPYIALDDPQVEQNVVNFESSLALFSGNDGFKHIYSWLKVAQSLLRSGEHYFFEVGVNQSHQFYIGQKINKMCCINKFEDLSGRIRVIQFEKF